MPDLRRPLAINALRALVAMAMASALASTVACSSQRSTASSALPQPQRQFWSSLEALCGKSFEGSVIEDTSADPRFSRKPLIMHVMRCEAGRVLIPFHIADDRSRTWIITTTPGGLRLKHDHRHEDGSEDELTQYGGDTRDAGTATRQQFFADSHTSQLIPAASTNIWTLEVDPARSFSYALERVGTERRFLVRFDLTRTVATPPLPWGW